MIYKIDNKTLYLRFIIYQNSIYINDKGKKMSFEFSDRSKDLQLRISKFLDDHVYPAEAIYAQQMEEFTQQGDRWQIPQIIEDKKEIAKSEGLWNLILPENPMG